MLNEANESRKIEATDLAALSAHWPDIRDWSPRSTGWGTINQTFFVGGESNPYVLKLYGKDTNPKQIRYEHRILAGLGQADLPFSTPSPLLSYSGETLLPVADFEGVLASLFPLLNGGTVRRGDPQHTHQAGAAMGKLHHALSNLPITPADAVLPSWGELARVHPLVPDPAALASGLGLATDTADALNSLIVEVMEAIASLPASLPRQITHADYLWPNLLFQDGLVSAVLDFEFATYDLRAFDFAGSLYHFGMLPWKTGEGWDLLEAFGSGYSERLSLTSNEIEALPLLLHWQRLGGLIYWAGVYRQGLTSYQSLVEAVEDNLLLEKWLMAQGQELVERSHVWFSTTDH